MFIITLLVLVSCRKEVTGPQGTSGVNGKDGVANMKVFGLTVKPSEWNYDDLYKQWYYQYNITDKYSDSAVVLTSLLTNNGYQAMPFTDKTFKRTYNFSENLSSDKSYVEIQYSSEDNPDVRPIDIVTFKMSIIPNK